MVLIFTARYRFVMLTATRPVGDLLKDWRQRRRMSQLALASDAEVSARHVSFIETGRARPSREMLVRLMERLEIPLRDRNRLLTAAGFAALYSERRLDDPLLGPARRAIDLVLARHEPNPALAIDRGWNLAAANRALGMLLAGVDPALLIPPVNVLRVALHPDGLAPKTVNFGQWRTHLLTRLKHEIDQTADPVLAELLAELTAYPAPKHRAAHAEPELIAPLRLQTEHGQLTFFSTTMVFGGPSDITLAELAIESFFPADQATAEIMRSLHGQSQPDGA
jgi:transcriptional regulator with XRE-family HTH domain